ncbi:hypothetical protein BJ166DRAFT_494530 [Pestalotiopsis sp. NC0098]|nr:hypothetical protein BJ166DRAFT_494530 [Pestalotiopsis sp. NC0098]
MGTLYSPRLRPANRDRVADFQNSVRARPFPGRAGPDAPSAVQSSALSLRQAGEHASNSSKVPANHMITSLYPWRELRTWTGWDGRRMTLEVTNPCVVAAAAAAAAAAEITYECGADRCALLCSALLWSPTWASVRLGAAAHASTLRLFSAGCMDAADEILASSPDPPSPHGTLLSALFIDLHIGPGIRKQRPIVIGSLYDRREHALANDIPTQPPSRPRFSRVDT